MSIKSATEFLELGKSYEQKLPAAPTEVLVQDVVVASIYILVKEKEKIISEYEKLIKYLQAG